MPATVLTAGTARVPITPPIGIHLSGYAGRAPSTAIHDDLYATALVLAEGDDLGPVIAEHGDMEGGTTPQAAAYRLALAEHVAVRVDGRRWLYGRRPLVRADARGLRRGRLRGRDRLPRGT